jgi:uncharacterized membrane protein YfcA
LVTTFITLFIAAILIGWIASMIGVGGGVFMVPFMTLLHYAPTTQVAVGTSLAVIIFNSISSTVSYTRQRVVDFRLGLMIMPTATVGSWLGAFLTRFISSGELAVAFGIFLIYVAVIMLLGKGPKEVALWIKRPTSDGDGESFSLWATGVIGLLAGLAAGFFGIGGGAVMVPTMTLLLGTDIIKAVATSLFVMGPSALIGSIQHYFQGNLRFDLAIPLALGIIIGAQLGAFTTTRVPKTLLQRLFGIVLLYSSLNMIWEGLH